MAKPPVGPLLRYCCLVLGAATTLALAAGPDYPPTAKRPVSDTYHGVTVVDGYRWLEDDASPEVKRWVAEQNALTRRYLDALPQRPAIAARVGELLRTSPVRRYDFEYRRRLFALKLQPPKDQPILVALPVSGDIRAEHVVLDLNLLDPAAHRSRGRTRYRHRAFDADRGGSGRIRVSRRSARHGGAASGHACRSARDG
jgi:hypothetical protein